MNEITENKSNRPSGFKILAVLFFIGIIAFSSVKLVKVAPEAFSSLASITESLSEYKNTMGDESNKEPDSSIVVTSDISSVSVGENVKLTWSESKTPGSFTFSYACTEGVALNIQNTDGIKNIDCDKIYNIGNQSTLSLTADSEKNTYSEVKYTIAFLGTNDTKPRANGTASLTIVNEKLSLVDKNKDVTEVATSSPTTPTKTVTTIPTPAVVKPTYQQEYIYTIPTSDPKGFTDLGLTFLNSGTIVRNNFMAGTIEQNDDGAIQFVIKNYGTKTSGEWTFSVTLPNNETYKSDKQRPLKPNERTVLAIGFPTDNDSKHSFVIKVDENTDRKSTNNEVSKTVTFVD